MASTVKTYRFIPSRSSTLESRTTRLSVVVPKMVDMGRDPGVGVSGVATRTVKLPASKNHRQLTFYHILWKTCQGKGECASGHLPFAPTNLFFFSEDFVAQCPWCSYLDWSNYAYIPPTSIVYYHHNK